MLEETQTLSKRKNIMSHNQLPDFLKHNIKYANYKKSTNNNLKMQIDKKNKQVYQIEHTQMEWLNTRKDMMNGNDTIKHCIEYILWILEIDVVC